MAPGWTSSQRQSQRNGKQQTISSFFTPKAVSATKETSSQTRQTEEELPDDGNSSLSSGEEQTNERQNPSKGLKRAEDGDRSDIENKIPDLKRRRKDIEPEDSSFSLISESGKRSEERRTSKEHQLPIVASAEERANGTKRTKISSRTSQYIFSSSGAEDEVSSDDDEVKRAKRKLHDRFVKKLGRPESIAEIKRRNHVLTGEGGEGGDEDHEAEEDEGDEEEEPAAKNTSKAKRGLGAKKSSNKLTPMERQVLDIKRKHMDTLLVVEVGYKFRFFGEDARTAAKELSIVCIPGKLRYDEHASEAHLDRFASASIPVHRLHVHVKRLVAAGHKVGVVRQLETAALKAAGDNRNAPFIRKLTNVYTKGTYIDDVEGLEGPVTSPTSGASSSGYLLCLTESNAKGWGNDEKVHIGIVAVQPATGDIIYDDFEDGFMRSEIETRLLHIAPCEFVIVGDISKATDKLIQHLSGSKSNVFGDRARVERVEKSKTMAAQAYSHVSNFYAGKIKPSATGSETGVSVKVLDRAHELSEHVTICLSAMIKHMTEYGLEHVFDLTKYFQPFSARSYMLLNGNTLTSLEIYQNQTDGSEKGSLFWTLDKTRTRFGRRLMRKWVGQPLLSRTLLEKRIQAVEEMRSDDRVIWTQRLKNLLSQIKVDLEKSLIRIYYNKCGRSELLGVLQTLQRIGNEFAHVRSPADAGFKSNTVNEAIAALPTITKDVLSYLEKINLQGAKADDRYTFFREEYETDAITEQKLGIASVEVELNEHRNAAAEKLRKKKIDYVTVAGIEYLIEVENQQLKNVPASWTKISGTKKVSRFHTPEVTKMIRERDQHKEALAAACDSAFTALLAEIATNYETFRDCVQSLASLDCLLSLAEVAGQPGYTKPEFTDEICISVEQGRHPMVEQLLLDSYVPNNIDLSSSDTRALLITGPNMGGKSSYVRQVALISIMAQIGSYVPATSAKLGLLDAVYTRMGAFDNMLAGESTFMVELSETSDILKQATPRSLVILDELGRGTSTHDGVAIAEAVLDYFLRDLQCLTLFITHYQNLSAMARSFDDGRLKNVHMKFAEEGGATQEITFLYEVGEGVAHRSYGLNVARLAKVPESVIDVAAVKSAMLEDIMRRKKLSSISRIVSGLLDHKEDDRFEQLVSGIEQL